MLEIKKFLSLSSDLRVNIIFFGESGVGKTLCARLVLPNAIVVDGSNKNDVFRAIKDYDEIIIEDFDKIVNLDIFLIDGKKIVATSQKKSINKKFNNLFAISIDIPPLRDRPEDIEVLSRHFLAQIQNDIDIKEDVPDTVVVKDISKNAHSLKRSIYQSYLSFIADKREFACMMEAFFYKYIDDENSYKKFIDLFDYSIIMANMKKYKSQLAVSKKMGINRNTLRKKISTIDKKLMGVFNE